MILSLGDVISKGTMMAGRSDFSASEASFYANLALYEISTRVHHKTKEALAVSNLSGGGDERRIAVPVDFDYMVAIKHYSTTTNDSGITLGTETDLDFVSTTLLDSFSSTTGDPVRYTVYGGYVELDPIPGSMASLVMRYAAKQPTLILSSETPDLDERWHPGWLYKTEELLHKARNNYAGASEAERRYVNYMISTPNDRQIEQTVQKGRGLWLRRG